MSVSINIFNNSQTKRIQKMKVSQAVVKALKSERISQAVINIVFVDNKEILKLNKQYLRHNYPTDVIAFSLGEGKEIEGEIYISAEVAKEQSKVYKVSFTNEIMRLAVHGTLHILGYDDSTSEQKEIMHNMENKFIAC